MSLSRDNFIQSVREKYNTDEIVVFREMIRKGNWLVVIRERRIDILFKVAISFNFFLMNPQSR